MKIALLFALIACGDNRHIEPDAAIRPASDAEPVAPEDNPPDCQWTPLSCGIACSHMDLCPAIQTCDVCACAVCPGG